MIRSISNIDFLNKDTYHKVYARFKEQWALKDDYYIDVVEDAQIYLAYNLIPYDKSDRSLSLPPSLSRSLAYFISTSLQK